MRDDTRRVLGTRLPPELQEEVGRRVSAHGYYDSASAVLRRELDRWYECLRRERRLLRDTFSGDEQALVADVLNGILMADHSAPAELWQEINDAVRLDPVAEKWQIDGPALVAKLRGLDYAGACAFVDAAERFWAQVSRGDQPDPRQLLEEPRGDTTGG